MPKSEDMDDVTPPAPPAAGGMTAAQKLAALRAGNSANPASPGSTSSMTPMSTPSYGSTTGGYGMSSSGYGASASPSTFGGGMNNQSQATGAMHEGGSTTLETSSGFGDFINSKWRPMMAMIYMITCTCDFVLFPIAWSVLQAMHSGQVHSQWNPITLQGAGLYHIAMGAVLGLAAYGRSQEKIAGKA